MKGGTTVRVDVIEEKKMIIVWKSTQEADKPIEKIVNGYCEYRSRKFRFIVMYSGTEDLFEPTLALLSMNRMKKAMQEASAEYQTMTINPDIEAAV